MPNWFSIQASKDKPKSHDILIYDQIGKDWFGGDGVSAKEFAEGLKSIPMSDDIVVSINSPGGNVWDGLAIYNQLKQRRDRVTTRVDGVAASIASVIALAGHKMEMPENAMFMIHDASGLAMGNAATMREMADKLDQHSDLLAGIYAEKTGKSREKMRAMMREETWMDGKDAVKHGFADSTSNAVKIAASFDLSAFRRVPSVLAKANTNPPPMAGQTKQEKQMNKTAILALLKEHGKVIAEDASDETILAAFKELMKPQASAPAAPKIIPNDGAGAVAVIQGSGDNGHGTIMIDAKQFKAMEARLKEEREFRTKSEFEAIAMDRPFLSAKEWLPKLYNDTDGSLMAALRAMPIVSRDNAPVFGRIQNNGNALIEKYRAMEPGKERQDFAKSHWNELQAAHDDAHIIAMSSLPVTEQLRRLYSPRADNTYSATLVTDRLADAFITTIGTRLSSLAAFSREFGTDRLKPRATVDVPKATSGSSTQTDPTNFESGDSVTDVVQIAVSQYSQDFHVTNDQLNKGHRLVTVAEKNAQNFANKLSDVWTDYLEVANFGAALAIGAAATFDANDLAPIYAVAKNYGRKNLILDGGHLAYLLPTDKFKFRLGEEGAYNFDLIAEHNRWTGAVANTVGLICDPNAFAIASGLPLELPSGEFIELGTVTVASLGLTAQLCHWFSRGGRTHWMSYDIMFGAKPGDTTAAEILVTA